MFHIAAVRLMTLNAEVKQPTKTFTCSDLADFKCLPMAQARGIVSKVWLNHDVWADP